VLKVFIQEDLQIGSGREFYSAGPATSNKLSICPLDYKVSFWGWA